MAAVTTAVTAVAGLAYSVYSSEEAKKDAEKAADVQEKKYEKGLELQEEQAEAQRVQAQTQQDQLSPYREAGTAALDQQQRFLGLQGPEAQAEAYASFQESPGQQFLREQGLRLAGSSAANRGVGGGERLRELSKFNQGLALQQYDTHMNRLSGISGQGLGATSGGISAGIANAGLSQQGVRDQAGLLGMQGAAEASGILGASDARRQTIENTLTALPGVINAVGGAVNTGTQPTHTAGLTMDVPNPNQYGGVA
jgi:hypothetical protein